ncbi:MULTISPECIES: DUF1345 domain-containing protein [unclassified Leucobacter]|uniref:DUF1345 domain-containing protein n=1 Tax=unclassified Leucobacter TaxID=2621730 RepID=UPI003017AF67
MADPRNARASIGAALSLVGEVVGALMQLLLIWLAAAIVWNDDGPDNGTLLRIFWCLFATLYLGATVISLNVLVRLDVPDPRATRILVGHPVARALATVLTFGASLLGLTVAIDLITALGSGQSDTVAEFTAIWSMLLSWAMFNWGYARIYFSRYHREADPPLVFPGSPIPRLVDFVYLAFTNATTFAVSDVQVQSTRMRWTIVWHTTLAFFFNALIIALVINVITRGDLLVDLLD